MAALTLAALALAAASGAAVSDHATGRPRRASRRCPRARGARPGGGPTVKGSAFHAGTRNLSLIHI